VERSEFQHDGLRLSYLDAGGDGDPLIAMHAHWMEGTTFAPLAAALHPDWRVIAPDQRGHGYSDHADSYTRDDYLGDLAALLTHLNLNAPVVLLGNSLGGVNAYQYAARQPERVRAMIIEDIGVEIHDSIHGMMEGWGGIFKTPEQLAERLGPRLTPYLKDSFRQVEGGWRLAFDPEDMVKSQAGIRGDHWNDWLRSDCPALVIRGSESRVTQQEHCEEMAHRRPNTRLQVLEGGHVLHGGNPAAFEKVLKEFLREI
jgi:esterase